MKTNNIQNNTTFSALYLSKGTFSKFKQAFNQMNSNDRTTSEAQVIHMLRKCFSDVKKDIYLHSFETKKNIHFQLSPSKTPLGALLEHNFVDFAPKMLKIEKSKTTPTKTIEEAVNFVMEIDQNREPAKIAIGFKR